ncbi:MAG: hypothetical protein KAW01_06515, partial [Deltaproteobacteria bacterium]|nr:hypothetical protein [Deltaproteobacteria bacterium]
ILFKPSSREKGAVVIVSLLVTGALAVGGLFCVAYINDLLPYVDNYRQYAQDLASDNPENADPDALHDALEATKGTLSPSLINIVTSLFAPSAWLEYLMYGQIIEGVEIGVNTPTPDPGGRGQPGQTVACSLSVEPKLAAPGEFVTVTITVPTIFRSRIVSISGQAGLSGFSIPPSGGSAAFSIPAGICEQTLPISYEAYGQEGLVSSGSTSVKVDFSAFPDFDHDGIVDRCDPDDDNDGSPDGADCAPLDPNRFPGNPEICGDGIDQDCDGEDKPCSNPESTRWMIDEDISMTWYEAQQYCAQKGGRLPSSEEHVTAWKDGGMQKHPNHTPGFQNWLYWDNGISNNFAGTFLYNYGMHSGKDPNLKAYVRCVENR